MAPGRGDDENDRSHARYGRAAASASGAFRERARRLPSEVQDPTQPRLGQHHLTQVVVAVSADDRPPTPMRDSWPRRSRTSWLRAPDRSKTSSLSGSP